MREKLKCWKTDTIIVATYLFGIPLKNDMISSVELLGISPFKFLILFFFFFLMKLLKLGAFLETPKM